jgi:hypothetical protein
MTAMFLGCVLRLMFKIESMALETESVTILRWKRETNTKLWATSITLPSVSVIDLVRTVSKLIQKLFHRFKFFEFSSVQTFNKRSLNYIFRFCTKIKLQYSLMNLNKCIMITSSQDA